MRQLGGMRGLMAKPSGKIIETPIKANFREGLTVLEYFSSTHGARKGLADTALKTADSGYLTRKLADVAQNVVITLDDCGTTQGITKGIIYRGEKVEVNLADSIRGRVSRANIVNPITDEVIVHENEMITADIARRIEQLGLEKIQVRSPMTCTPRRVCQRARHGLATPHGGGGMAVYHRPVDRRTRHQTGDAAAHRRRGPARVEERDQSEGRHGHGQSHRRRQR
jgi:DNA-directed RNA polymerase subunit beta'